MKKTTVNKIALLGVFGAVALVLSFLESTLTPDIPFMPPGAKLGLSNIVTMLAASFFGLGSAVYITLLKGLFAFATRGATAAVMSLCGGLLSTFGLGVLIKHEGKSISFFSIGVLCAVLHNFGQLAVSCVITGTASLINYSKYLLLFAIITGSITGLMLNVVMPRLKNVLIKASAVNCAVLSKF